MRDRFLAAPEKCDNCSSPDVTLTTNDRLYGVKKGTWPYIFYCNDCGASVGCHPGTHNPLGKLADKHTRTLRRRLHEVFDVFWMQGYMTRTEAYAWLAEQLKITSAECHVSQLTFVQLKEAIRLTKDYFQNNQRLLDRRKEKLRAKSLRSRKREHKAINRRKSKGNRFKFAGSPS